MENVSGFNRDAGRLLEIIMNFGEKCFECSVNVNYLGNLRGFSCRTLRGGNR